MNPLNQLPIDADMVRRVDELAEAFAKETGHMVFVIAMKENEKTMISTAGVPDSGLLADLAKDWPRFLGMVAFFMQMSDKLDKREPKS